MHYADDELNTLAEAIVRSMDGEEPDFRADQGLSLMFRTLKKQVDGFHKRRLAMTLCAILHFGTFVRIEQVGINGTFKLQTEKLTKQQFHGIHHTSGDFGYKDKHFHRHKDRTIFVTMAK